MNAFFYGHLNSKTTLKQFVEQYENALRSKVLKEASADSDSFSSNVRCATHYDMEKQVQVVNTISTFKEFQKELTNKYIIRRWKKDVKRCLTRVTISYSNWVATPEAQNPDKMQKTFDDIKELANDSDDKCMLVVRWMHKLKEKICKHDGAASSTPQSPIAINSDPLPNPSQCILMPLSVRDKGRPPSKRKQSKTEQKSVESDAICHIDGLPPCRSDNIVATQESNVTVKHSHHAQGGQICMPANQYPIFPHTNENMTLLLELSQGGHPNPL
ncbi:hypothetical protein ACFX2H_002702 [Malus domestica]